MISETYHGVEDHRALGAGVLLYNRRWWRACLCLEAVHVQHLRLVVFASKSSHTLLPQLSRLDQELGRLHRFKYRELLRTTSSCSRALLGALAWSWDWLSAGLGGLSTFPPEFVGSTASVDGGVARDAAITFACRSPCISIGSRSSLSHCLSRFRSGMCFGAAGKGNCASAPRKTNMVL